jgi:hypothetical protein
MPADADDCCLRYVVARLAAYRNVWWSMANEFDLMTLPQTGGVKTVEDFDRFFQIVQRSDPYDHLRPNHNCVFFYDHNKPWVTHDRDHRAVKLRPDSYLALRIQRMDP